MASGSAFSWKSIFGCLHPDRCRDLRYTKLQPRRPILSPGLKSVEMNKTSLGCAPPQATVCLDIPKSLKETKDLDPGVIKYHLHTSHPRPLGCLCKIHVTVIFVCLRRKRCAACDAVRLKHNPSLRWAHQDGPYSVCPFLRPKVGVDHCFERPVLFILSIYSCLKLVVQNCWRCPGGKAYLLLTGLLPVGWVQFFFFTICPGECTACFCVYWNMQIDKNMIFFAAMQVIKCHNIFNKK